MASATATYRIVHTTRYAFSEVTESCILEARLRARDLPAQACRFHQLVVRPLAGKRRDYADGFGNPVTRFEVAAAHQTLEVSAINVVDMLPRPWPDLATTPSWEAARPKPGASAEGLAAFLEATPLTAATPELIAYARESFPPGRPVMEAACDLTRRIHRDFAYAPGATTVETTAAEAAGQGKGVCQDFAHIAIACLRTLGLAACYVSGYLDTSAVKSPGAPPGGDVSHAWFAVHVPEAGWIGFDPANDRPAADGYVTLAWGRDYRDAAPLSGASAGGGRHRFQVSVDMAREDATLLPA